MRVTKLNSMEDTLSTINNTDHWKTKYISAMTHCISTLVRS